MFSSKNSDITVTDHLIDVSKMVQISDILDEDDFFPPSNNSKKELHV